jgi:hypothetical protein
MSVVDCVGDTTELGFAMLKNTTETTLSSDGKLNGKTDYFCQPLHGGSFCRP